MSQVSWVNIQVNIRTFLNWLADQPGYKKKITHSFVAFFGPNRKEQIVANANRLKAAVTPEQTAHAFRLMPTTTVFVRRNRALFAFMVLTGARIEAVASLKVGYVALVEGCVFQDGAEVRTNFAKTFTTYLLPVGQMYDDRLSAWISELKENHLFGPDDPLFPKPKIVCVAADGFRNSGLSKDHCKSNDQLRKFINATFEAAGLPPFKPHRFCNTRVALSNRFIVTPEERKEVSMNLGHSSVRTTIDDYGQLSPQRQGEVLMAMRKRVR